MRQQYIEICGISDQELHENFTIELHEFADAQGFTYDKICTEMRERYDGYHFTYDSEDMYNPKAL